MRFVKALLTLVVVLALAAGALWLIAPQTPWPQAATLEAAEPGADLDAWLAQREGVFDDLTEGAEKRIFWAAEPGARSDIALVYLHGFSATRREISPVTEELAARLGANLFATRFAGHGRPGNALGEATVTDWALDLAEAMAVARRIGDRVVLVGTSTGGSMAVLAALDPAYADDIAAIVTVSPNFALNNAQAWMLDLPFASRWLPLLVGETYAWEPRNDLQARFWSTSYPTTALFPMRSVQRAAAGADHGAATVPLLVFYAAGDQVVVPAATARVIQNWGARVDSHVITGSTDASQHVIAGDILSPGTNDFVIDTAFDWLSAL